MSENGAEARQVTQPPRQALAEGGVTLSRLVAGCMRLVKRSGGALAAVHSFIDAALAAGITSFDHADIYGGYEAQALFGRALTERPGLRAQIELISKVGVAPLSARFPQRRVLHYDNSGAHIRASVEQTLRDLCTDRIDLLLLHRPDPLLHADEVARTLTQLRDDGKVRAFGVSNFSVGQFAYLQSRLPFALVTNQIELSILATDALRDGTLDDLRLRGLPAMAWSPLAGGKLFSADKAAAHPVQPILARLAGEYGCDAAALAMAWILRLDERMVVVLGTVDPQRLALAAAATRIELAREDWFELFAAAGNRLA